MNTPSVSTLCMIIAVVSFLGFWVENIWLTMTKGYMDNRNMRLPFLIGYGLAMVAIFGMFGTPQSLRFFSIPIPVPSASLGRLIYFVLVSLCVAVGEILLGTFVEKTCGIVWWNYSRLPMHITKYTSIPTTCTFGMLITVFMGSFFTPLCQRFGAIPGTQSILCASALMALMVGDFLQSTLEMYKTRTLRQRWRIDMTHTRLHKLWLSQHPV